MEFQETPAVAFDNTLEGLKQLVEKGKEALHAKFAPDRVTLALAVMPLLVNALDQIVKREDKVLALRMELTAAVRELREQVWAAQKMHPEVTFANAHIYRILREINGILVKIDRELFSV